MPGEISVTSDMQMIPLWQKAKMKTLLRKVKEESEKVSLKLNIQNMRLMASSPTTSWQTDGKTMETVREVIFLGSKIIADSDSSHEITRCLHFGTEKAMTPHSSTLAWKIPWMEELVGCSPWGR